MIKDRKMDWIPLCPGLPPVINRLELADQNKTFTLPQRSILARTNLPLLSGLSWALCGLHLGYKTTKKNTIFDNVVTIFFRLQRKLKEKNYLFQNSCPEEITTPLPLDHSTPDHLSRPSLIPESKRKKKKKNGEQSLLKSYFKNFLQIVLITKFGKQSYRMSCVYLDICMSQCVSFFFLDNIADCWDQFVNELWSNWPVKKK